MFTQTPGNGIEPVKPNGSRRIWDSIRLARRHLSAAINLSCCVSKKAVLFRYTTGLGIDKTYKQ